MWYFSSLTRIVHLTKIRTRALIILVINRINDTQSRQRVITVITIDYNPVKVPFKALTANFKHNSLCFVPYILAKAEPNLYFRLKMKKLNRISVQFRLNLAGCHALFLDFTTHRTVSRMGYIV